MRKDAPTPLSRADIDALAARLRPHYRRFLDPLGDDILLTAHSHQAWPDVSRAAHLAAWDDAARLIDQKWGKILDDVLPELQARVASRLGSARPADLAIAPNTHELVYRLASCFPHDATVVTTDSEFHSLSRQLARLGEDQLRVVEVAAEPPALAERLLAAVDAHRPDWVALSMVLYTTARVITDLPEILRGLAEREVPVLIDAYHGFNVVPMNVDSWPGSVFVTGGGYKYAQTGEGACWMLLPADASRYRPRHTGWFAAFDSLAEGASAVSYGPGGRRFLGSTFDPSGLYRGVAVLRWMDEQGLSPEALCQHAQARTQLIIAAADRHHLADHGCRVASPRAASERGGFVAIERADATELVQRLRRAGVHTDARGQLLRLGPAPYTSSDDIERALAILAGLVGAR
ncbi:MAG: kynureninase [Haliangiales bacterium]